MWIYIGSLGTSLLMVVQSCGAGLPQSCPGTKDQTRSREKAYTDASIHYMRSAFEKEVALATSSLTDTPTIAGDE